MCGPPLSPAEVQQEDACLAAEQVPKHHKQSALAAERTVMTDAICVATTLSTSTSMRLNCSGSQTNGGQRQAQKRPCQLEAGILTPPNHKDPWVRLRPTVWALPVHAV